MNTQIVLIILSVAMFSASGFVEGRNRKTGKAFWFFIAGCVLLFVGLYFQRIALFIQATFS